MFLSIREAASLLEVAIITLRRWDRACEVQATMGVMR